MEIYFKTDMTLDALAETLRRALNLPEQNRTPYQKEQKRVGANFGGEYYLFEGFGLELYLLHNGGEAAVPERAECRYYLYAEAGAAPDEEMVDCMTRQIFAVTRRAGLECHDGRAGAMMMLQMFLAVLLMAVLVAVASVYADLKARDKVPTAAPPGPEEGVWPPPPLV